MYQIIVNQSFIHIVATIKAVPVIAETKTGNHKIRLAANGTKYSLRRIV